MAKAIQVKRIEVSAASAERIFHNGGREKLKRVHLCMTLDEGEDPSCFQMDSTVAANLIGDLKQELNSQGVSLPYQQLNIGFTISKQTKVWIAVITCSLLAFYLLILTFTAIIGGIG